MPKLTKRSGERRGISTTSRSFSICSLQPPTSPYVTSGLSSTVIIVTEGSIFGGKGRRIWYLFLSTLERVSRKLHCVEINLPNSHAFFDISRADSFTQVHDKLGDLLDIDNVFALLGIFIILNDLRTPGDLERLFFLHPLSI